MDVYLNPLLKMPPEMSKIAIYFCFFPYFMITQNTSFVVLQQEKVLFFRIQANFVLHGRLEKRYLTFEELLLM